MKKHYQTDRLQQLIDWDNIMKMPRYAGGHDEQMQGLFKHAQIVAHWNEGDYQGMVATCVMFTYGEFKGKYVIYNDYYGSCSGCDSWEDADNESVRSMCIDLSNGAYVFESLSDVIEYLEQGDKDYSWDGAAHNLLELIKQKQHETI